MKNNPTVQALAGEVGAFTKTRMKYIKSIDVFLIQEFYLSKYFVMVGQ